jgi:CubicO group peptidase (beta-lactamase class C family)
LAVGSSLCAKQHSLVLLSSQSSGAAPLNPEASAVGQPLCRFAHEQLDAPLAISNSTWAVSAQNGATHAGGGLRMRPRDMLKIGQLVLNGGNWRGVQVVSERWIRESTAPWITNVTTFGSWPASYGYLWWRLPDGVIAAVGR